METKVFKSYKEFRKALKVSNGNFNGVSVSHSEKFKNYYEDNINNKRCWNCTNCSECEDCINCIGCLSCYVCNSCEDCEGCIDCKSCDTCEDCIDCKSCDECDSCVNCINLDGIIGGDSKTVFLDEGDEDDKQSEVIKAYIIFVSLLVILVLILMLTIK